MTRRYSARAHFVVVGAATIAGTWAAAVAVLFAAWCRAVKHLEHLP